MPGLKKVSNEVFVAESGFLQTDRAEIEMLKAHASRSPRHRSRICAHYKNESRIHEMLIVLTDEVYIRPHKHLRKSESYHVIEGSATVVYFDDNGGISDVLRIGDKDSGRSFYFRNDDERYHTQIVTAPFLVFHETTNGPFDPAETVFAPWSPDDTNPDRAATFLADLKTRADRYKGAA
jgi:cupin fold WbuC family metalloprotein